MIRRFEPLLAAFVIVAALVVAGAVVFRDTTDAPSLDDALALGEPSDPLVLPTPVVEPTVAPSAPMSVTVSIASTVTVSGRVPDDDTAADVLDAVTEVVSDTDLVDQLSVVDSVISEGAIATITGQLPDVETSEALVDALTALGFEVINQVTVGGEAATVGVVLDTDPRLTRFRALLDSAGLLDRLGDDGPLTVFAPTDDTLAALDPAVAAQLDDPDRLRELMAGHLLEAEVFEQDLAVPQTLTTLSGDTIALAGDRTVNGVAVVEGNLFAGNGVVHLVDGLVLTGSARTELALNELVLAQPVQFTPGSAELLTSSQDALAAVAAILADETNGAVEVQGHTDTDGDEDDNLALSQARAEAVVVYLTAVGVDPDRLTAVGFGETEPKVDPEVTPDDKATNRRIEFRVTGTLDG